MGTRAAACAQAAACALAFQGLTYAHAIPLASTPAANQVVPPGVLSISIKFNSRIDSRRSRLVLMSPAGKTSTVAAEAVDESVTLRGHAVLDQPGRWILHWQVLAIDGHITRGEVPFVVSTPSAQR